MLRSLGFLLLSVGCCQAGDWQASAAIGFGAYHPLTLTAPAGIAQAGIGPRAVLNVSAGRQLGDHVAIEGAWTFQDGDFELVSGSTKTAFDADAYAVHVDLLGYLRSPSSRLRPYLVCGAGAKFFHGIEAASPRPLVEFGSFRNGIDSRTLLAWGGGAEWKVSTHWSLRFDLRDYVTPFPRGVIVPVAEAKLSGQLQDFVAVVGLTFRLSVPKHLNVL
jgi:Outer membrane protein beta-barrel domain